MSFDARSKERLEALGRTLPKKLPLPSEAKQEGTARHSLEREEDPAELFRVLMQTSPDGTVPPHLLDRLRELESSPAPAPAPETGHRSERPSKRPKGRATGVGKEEQDLYSAFAQLLLDDDDA